VRKGAIQCDSDDGERRGQGSIETRAGPSKEGIISPKAAKEMARPPGLEPGTAGLEIREPAPVAASEPDKSYTSEIAPADTPAVKCTAVGVSCPDGDAAPACDPGEERELSELCSAWPNLSPSVKAAIRALLQVRVDKF
jgi:hypothetical protein